MRRLLPILAAVAAASGPLPAVNGPALRPDAPEEAAHGEVQAHGILFEDWVRREFFGGGKAEGYTTKWDIPAERNTAYGGIPANPKAAKYGAPVGLGDALRQFDVDEPFLLILGYWRQEGDMKRFVTALAVRVEPDQWRALWGPVTRADLERLDAVIKDRSKTPEEARRAAQEMKNSPPFRDAVFTLNPKIDSHTQRRLQCSLAFKAVFEKLAPGADPCPVERPAIFGKPLPGPFKSPPRSFAKSSEPQALDEDEGGSGGEKTGGENTDGL